MSDSRLTPAVNDHDQIDGPADAPVTLVEYGDFECPYCGMAYPVVKAAQQELGPRLRFVFRNFPLTQAHAHAEHAAEAAQFAGAHGRFWEMHDTLYEHQRALDDAHLAAYAAELGLDADQLLTALSDGTHAERVRADFRSGVRSGVNGTPTFFINDERYDGNWQDAEEFVAALAAAADDAPAPSADAS